jgi:hypothetical protein
MLGVANEKMSGRLEIGPKFSLPEAGLAAQKVLCRPANVVGCSYVLSQALLRGSHRIQKNRRTSVFHPAIVWSNSQENELDNTASG